LFKYIVGVFVVFALIIGGLYGYFSRSLFIDFRPNAEITAIFRAEGASMVCADGEPMLLRGVELTPSKPGHMAWDFAPSVDDYLRWFEQISEMGANSIYVPTTMSAAFYRALYNYNYENESPLFVLQGIPGHDYRSLTSAARETIDIIHGNRINYLGRGGVEFFLNDISPWVVGLLLGTELDPDVISYYNHFNRTAPREFEGDFFSAAAGANPFEVMLAMVMDNAASYESRRFKTQRPIGFALNPTNDFLVYEIPYATQLRKYVQLDPQNIVPQEAKLGGIFAAYRLFFFTDDFASLLEHELEYELAPCFMGGYLSLLAQHHSMPVIAAGFGVSSARAPQIMGRPPLNERQQGHALVDMIYQIESNGWAGSFISTWQDNWERRTWNTAFSSDPWRYHYWFNVQSVDQNYGLLAFDTGDILLDGTRNGWYMRHLVHEENGFRIFAQYTARGLYLMVDGESVSPRNSLVLPINVTPNSGTDTLGEMEFAYPADFLLVLEGVANSRLLVNQRYNSTFQRFFEEQTGQNPFVSYYVPPRWGAEFVPIAVALQNTTIVSEEVFILDLHLARQMRMFGSFETGRLTHGTNDPTSANFNSLTDFAFGENMVEIRLPWMLLNFYDPSIMRVHDDYFDNFGVEGLGISHIYIGVTENDSFVPMSPIPLTGWRNSVEFRERLKESYFIIKNFWNGTNSS